MSSLSRVYATQVSGLIPHSNADNLLVGQYNGMPFIVNKNDTHQGDWRLIVPFDTITPNESWVSEFVRGERIRPVRLRGQFSMCVCIPLPPGEICELDEDVTERFGFKKYERSFEREDDGISTNGDSGREIRGPELYVPHYDLESLRKYHGNLVEGETVVITEKIDGENIAIVYWNDKYWVRSRKRWIENDVEFNELWDSPRGNKWWLAFHAEKWQYLASHPGLVAYGEKFGNVNGWRYGLKNGVQRITLFDFYDAVAGRYLSPNETSQFRLADGDLTALPAPILYYGEWKGYDAHKELAEGPSTLDSATVREGIVVTPVDGRLDRKGNRVKYKLHGEGFLIKKGKQK